MANNSNTQKQVFKYVEAMLGGGMIDLVNLILCTMKLHWIQH